MIKQRTTRTIYENPWMKVREDSVEFPNGLEGIYSVVEKSDFVLIIPFDGSHYYLVNQYRYPTGMDSLEFPEGKHENNSTSTPQELAIAELAEETGLTADHMEKIGFFHVMPGTSNQGVHIFMATGLTQKERNLESTEQGLEVVKMNMSQLDEMIHNGTITDASTVAAYALLKTKNLSNVQ